MSGQPAYSPLPSTAAGGLAGSAATHRPRSRFRRRRRDPVRVIGHLTEDVQLPLQFGHPAVALVLLHLGGRERGLKRFVERAGGLVGDSTVVVADLALDALEPVA